jgi:hypothetical protein
VHTDHAGNKRITGSPFLYKGRLRAYLKRPSAKRTRELHNPSRNQLRIMMELLTVIQKDTYLNWG